MAQSDGDAGGHFDATRGSCQRTHTVHQHSNTQQQHSKTSLQAEC